VTSFIASGTDTPILSASICHAGIPASVSCIISSADAFPFAWIWPSAVVTRSIVSALPPSAGDRVADRGQRRDHLLRREAHRQQPLRRLDQVGELERRLRRELLQVVEERLRLLPGAEHRRERDASPRPRRRARLATRRPAVFAVMLELLT
jgi:hypothetical protein